MSQKPDAASKKLASMHHKIAEKLEIGLPVVKAALPQERYDDAAYFYKKIQKISGDKGMEPDINGSTSTDLGLLMLPFSLAAWALDGLFNSKAAQFAKVKTEFEQYVALVSANTQQPKSDLSGPER